MAMPQFIIIVTKALFVSIVVHTIDGVKSKPQISKGTKFYEFA
jgi:hypothetical protein